jgi:hypothetical protein
MHSAHRKGAELGKSGRHYRRLVPKAGPLKCLPRGSLPGEESSMTKQPCNHLQRQYFSQPHFPTSSNQPSKSQIAAPAHGQIAGVRSCSPPKGILETQPRSLEDTKEPHGCRNGEGSLSPTPTDKNLVRNCSLSPTPAWTSKTTLEAR